MKQDDKKLESMRHSCEHVLTQAMLKLFPGIKMAMGPAIADGFYFDFDPGKLKISEDDFPKIEAEMRNIVALNLPIKKEEISIEKAREIFKGNEYKQEWLNEIEARREKANVYWTGDKFVDLCSGPHVKSTGEIGAFKLLSIAGAYWRGSENNKMLTRIYGTCFPTKKELDQCLLKRAAAKEVDHRKLGVQLGLWTFSELVGGGLPLFTPKGTLVRQLINEFVEELQSKQGITQVWTPQIAKAELFKISGHYDKYRENMFSVKSNYSDEEFYLKPMNCPQHTQIYASQMRSYKDLPLRLADFAMLYRDERPGELIGLIRTRSFSQDDCHIFCREDQIVEEMNKALDMTKEIMDAYGFAYKYRLSLSDPKHPEKYLGDKKTWQKAEKICREILEGRKIEYFEGIGEAAFYAPKLDLIATDSLGREWQLSTLQVDFFMPERFDLWYTDEDNSRKRPVMLHRAISGSPERLMAILLEHFAGAFPVWLSPTQVVIIPITDNHIGYANKVSEELNRTGIRVEVDDRQETTSAKIRDAEIEKIPYMLIVGDKEIKGKKVNVRARGEKVIGMMTLEKFINRVADDIAKKRAIC
jgi:threonyl-tRNA synthetase